MIEPTSPGPYAPLMLTSPGARVPLMLTSPGPRVPLMLTSPGPHVTNAWQVSSSRCLASSRTRSPKHSPRGKPTAGCSCASSHCSCSSEAHTRPRPPMQSMLNALIEPCIVCGAGARARRRLLSGRRHRWHRDPQTDASSAVGRRRAGDDVSDARGDRVRASCRAPQTR